MRNDKTEKAEKTAEEQKTIVQNLDNFINEIVGKPDIFDEFIPDRGVTTPTEASNNLYVMAISLLAGNTEERKILAQNLKEIFDKLNISLDSSLDLEDEGTLQLLFKQLLTKFPLSENASMEFKIAPQYVSSINRLNEIKTLVPEAQQGFFTVKSEEMSGTHLIATWKTQAQLKWKYPVDERYIEKSKAKMLLDDYQDRVYVSEDTSFVVITEKQQKTKNKLIVSKKPFTKKSTIELIREEQEYFNDEEKAEGVDKRKFNHVMTANLPMFDITNKSEQYVGKDEFFQKDGSAFLHNMYQGLDSAFGDIVANNIKFKKEEKRTLDRNGASAKSSVEKLLSDAPAPPQRKFDFTNQDILYLAIADENGRVFETTLNMREFSKVAINTTTYCRVMLEGQIKSEAIYNASTKLDETNVGNGPHSSVSA